VGCVLPGDDAPVLADLREALRGRSELVVIDGADRLRGGERDQVAAMLRDARSRRELAVFATAADPDAARSLLADAGWPSADVLDTRAPRPSAAETTEVPA
jgi:RND superfamily putative drug exporter